MNINISITEHTFSKEEMVTGVNFDRETFYAPVWMSETGGTVWIPCFKIDDSGEAIPRRQECNKVAVKNPTIKMLWRQISAMIDGHMASSDYDPAKNMNVYVSRKVDFPEEVGLLMSHSVHRVLSSEELRKEQSNVMAAS